MTALSLPTSPLVFPTRNPEIVISLGVPAIGKPRMTRRDKWAKRPCVTRYRAFADELRQVSPPMLPPAADVELLSITAYYRPPPSWSRKRKEAAIGTRKRTMPDGSNILKGVEDILFPAGDQALGDCHVGRWWATRDAMFVSIWTKEPTA